MRRIIATVVAAAALAVPQAALAAPPRDICNGTVTDLGGCWQCVDTRYDPPRETDPANCLAKDRGEPGFDHYEWQWCQYWILGDCIASG